MKKTTQNKKKIAGMSVMELAELVVDVTNDCEEINTAGPAKAYLDELAKRLCLSPMEAMFLSVFLNQSDDNRINYKDIARHFDVRPLKILSLADVVDGLVLRGAIIKRKDKDGDVTFRMPHNIVESLRRGELPMPEPKTNLDAQELVDEIFHCLELRDEEEIEDKDLHYAINKLIDENSHLPLCQNLKGLKLADEDLVLFLVLSMCFVNNHDDKIARIDIDDYFDRRTFRKHSSALENGTHILMEKHLVEHSCEDGQINPEQWKLTNYSKQEVLTGLKLAVKKDNRSNVTRHETIAEKKLYFNERVSKQVSKLQDLLEDEKMKRVMDRLKEKGMRRGFTCIFYGAPGTGKTETVLQLSRLSGRDIMLVDVPSIRSKWVGETEQNIKAVFERYGRLARNNEKAPILLFNEADALLNKRAEGATGSVDKMENAMQNIILQEMENLEGIMIATTNLTGSLDPAFERRFLYKVEFDRPTPNERKHIWKAMLPELSEEQSLSLASQFDFSGGQIENIARKHAIDSILSDDSSFSMEEVEELCRQEKLDKQSKKQIGFC